MKRLHDKVNVIPLIAKADTLTPEECQLFKKQVRVCGCVTLVGLVMLLLQIVVNILRIFAYVIDIRCISAC